MLDPCDTEALAAERRAAGIAEHLLATEGRLLDLQDWDAWLDCYTEDCTYWVPVWKDEVATVSDPAREVSLIYHTSRLGLEERVIAHPHPQKRHCHAPASHSAHGVRTCWRRPAARTRSPAAPRGTCSTTIRAFASGPRMLGITISPCGATAKPGGLPARR